MTQHPEPEPMPQNGTVVLKRPIPIIVQRDVWVIVGLVVLAGLAFGLLNSVAGDRLYPSIGDLTLGLAVAMLWPVAAVLHETAHAVAGAIIGRPPVYAQVGLVPGVALTPPPADGWARVLVSGSGPLVEIGAGLLYIVLSPGDGAGQFLTDPLAMIGAVCVLNGGSNLVPGPKNSDGGKLWRAVWRMVRPV